tara:strand:- start:394 stop:864 length:471 start_codon:yes stop_codon:yes gene_type:complete
MKTILSILTLTLSLTLLIGCEALTGKEVARLPINAVTIDNNNLLTKEATLDLKKGEEILIWSEMDFEYEGDVALRFKIEIAKNDSVLTIIEIDPTEKNISMSEVKTSFMNKTDWSFSGKNAEYKIKEDGTYTFKGLLVASENSTLKVNKAELVLKK